jgi:hypothetical protein
MSLLGLANQTLTTPSLIEVTRRFGNHIPEDVRGYVQNMFERNIERNNRLCAQLAEAVGVINDRGVTPILFKGAAILATSHAPDWGSQLMSDLDVMVPADKVDVVLESLFSIGYRVDNQTLPDAEKWHIDLKRSCDVGMIDLHRNPPGPAYFYRAAGDPKQHCRTVQIGRGLAYVPTATYHALILTLHDQFQDADYWLGNVDLRHLIDLRNLAHSPEGIDWDLLDSFVPDMLARNALATQLITLFFLLGVNVPARRRMGRVPRLQLRRRLIQARFPLLRHALLFFVAFDYINFRNYRNKSSASKTRRSAVERWRLVFARLGRLGFLFSLSRINRVGKV